MKIVNAEEKHILVIRDICTHHVLHGTGNFETDPPDAYGVPARLEKIRSLEPPWAVTLQEDKVIGYCYLTRYRERYAYRYTLEDPTYIAPATQRQGVGKALLRHMTGWAEAQGYRQLIVIIGDNSSQGLLEVYQRAGFTRIGTLKNTGLRHGLRLDTVLLQYDLGRGNGTLPPDSGVTI